MYQNISPEDKQDQFQILFLRAIKNAKAKHPSLSTDDFRKQFSDRDMAAKYLSQDDMQIYDACRP